MMKINNIQTILFFCVLSINTIYTKNIYIIPFTDYSFDALFDLAERDECNRPFFLLREALHTLGYSVLQMTPDESSADTTAVLILNMPNAQILEHLMHYKNARKILFLFEPPTIMPVNYDQGLHKIFDIIFSLADYLIDRKKYKKLYYPQPCLKMVEQQIPFNKKKLCTFIAGNKSSKYHLELYSQRRNAVLFFEQYHPNEFDLYGGNWPKQLKTYKGSIRSKTECLKHYKFCICYENTRDLAGYITEKIFDCFVTGCVPIYWGADNITQYIPAECFIDRKKFATHDALYNYLQSMDQKTYEQYINAIHTFLNSLHAFLFSSEFFVHRVLQEIEPGYAQDKIFSQDQIEKIMQAEQIDNILYKKRNE